MRKPLAKDYTWRPDKFRAYRIQLKTGNYHSPQFAVNALMTKYGLGMNDRSARKALGI